MTLRHFKTFIEKNLLEAKLFGKDLDLKKIKPYNISMGRFKAMIKQWESL